MSGGKVYATKAGRFTFHVVLFDLDGRLLCSMDGGALTQVRTPALCAVAIRRFASPSARTAALLGTGVEAVPHLEMLARELPLEDLRVWGRSAERAQGVVDHGVARGMPVRRVDRSDEAVAGAEVIVAVTSANQPIFEASAVRDDALVCAVGATKPERCELPPELFARAGAVVVDSLEGSRSECGDLLHAVAEGCISWDAMADLADVLGGSERWSRPDGDGPIIFETQGVAIQDVAGAASVWFRHRGGGVRRQR